MNARAAAGEAPDDVLAVSEVEVGGSETAGSAGAETAVVAVVQYGDRGAVTGDGESASSVRVVRHGVAADGQVLIERIGEIVDVVHR